MSVDETFIKIRAWAEERGIYESGDVKTQALKAVEEVGELAHAILREDRAEAEDAVGDIVVVLTNLCELMGTPIEECISGAWEEIKDRKGKMVEGNFVKDE